MSEILALSGVPVNTVNTLKALKKWWRMMMLVMMMIMMMMTSLD